MSLVDILEPVLNNGIRNTNFFNGRLLAAEDLTDLQTANAQQHQQLALAIGEGVVNGLEVTVAPASTFDQPVLHVTQGLAFNREGQAVALPGDVDLALVPLADVQNAEAGLFAVCKPETATILTNPGLYLLTLAPASGLSTENAPKTDVLDPGVATTCDSRWVVEGARFNRVQLDLGVNPDPASLAGIVLQLGNQLNSLTGQLAVTPPGPAADALRAQIAPLMSKFRNCAAHLCFGTETFAGFPADPFGRANGSSRFAEYGAVDHLRDLGNITDCQVPLAIFYWSPGGLQFVDMWSVRRPVFASAASSAWAPLAGRRREVEGLAMFLQFQCQVSGLVKDLNTGSATSATVFAHDFFRYLPAAGIIPIASIKGSLGFDYLQFFQGRTYHDPVFIEGAKLLATVERSFLFPAIDFGNQEMLWLYRVRENMQAVAASAALPPRPLMVFTNGHLPYEGDAQFDLSYWDYANYA
jgi:hypothetical protein